VASLGSRRPFTRERERRPGGVHGKAVMTRLLVRVVPDRVRATGLLRPLFRMRQHLQGTMQPSVRTSDDERADSSFLFGK